MIWLEFLATVTVLVLAGVRMSPYRTSYRVMTKRFVIA